MRNSVFILFLCVLASYAQEPGMTAQEFKKKFPGILPASSKYTQNLTKEETFGAIKGNWYFAFINDTLRDLFFSSKMGPRLKPEQVSSYMEMYIKDKANESTFNFKSGDTTANVKRNRKYDLDTVLFYEVRTSHGIFQKGLFFTGNYKMRKSNEEAVTQHYNNAPRAEYFIFTVKFKREDAGRLTPAPFYTGMHIRDFAESQPDLFPKGVPGVAGQYQLEHEMHGLKGKWSYTFRNDVLDWKLWDYYQQEVTKAEFDKCVEATKKIIADYNAKYGKTKYITKIAKYKANSSTGYSVLRAEWKLSEQNIVVEFYFMGGKAGRQYLVKAEHKLRKQ